MRLLVAAFAALLCGCAGAPKASALPATRITFEVNSWGYVQERWTIVTTGEASLERPPRGAQLGTPAEMQTFAVSASDFERIRTALAPNERFIATGLECERRITDAPYGTVKWLRSDGAEQQVSFYAGCRSNAGVTSFFEHIGAADDLFHQITRTPED